MWAVMIGILLFLGAGMVTAYSIYTRIETTLKDLQIAYAIEQTKTEKLSQKADELSNRMEQARARERALEEKQGASEQEKSEWQAKSEKIETDLKKLQAAYTTEQARTKMLTQTGGQLLKAVEQAQAQLKALEEARARVKVLEQSQKVSSQEKSKLQAQSKRLQQAHQVLRRAYTAEEGKTKKLTQKVQDQSKTVKQAEERIKSLEARQKGEMMKVEKELQWKRQAEGWGKGFREAIDRIFF